GGVYIMNVIDYSPFRFAKAELRTLQAHFPWVATVSPNLAAYHGGNIVIVGSDRRLFDSGFHSSFAPAVPMQDEPLQRCSGTAPTIRDDFAPIDQWLDADANEGG